MTLAIESADCISSGAYQCMTPEGTRHFNENIPKTIFPKTVNKIIAVCKILTFINHVMNQHIIC